jgi:hypothetical protein
MFLSCTATSVKKADENLDGNNKQIEKAIEQSVIVEDSGEIEFNSIPSVPQLFQGNEADSNLALSNNADRKPLEITTKNKKNIFNNISTAQEENMKNYFYFGYNAHLNKHLVYASYYEFDEFLLIDNTTAQIDTLIGKPYFSPDTTKLFCFYINPYEPIEINDAYYPKGDIEIYFLQNNHLKVLFKHNFNFLPYEIKWINNNTILVKAVLSSDYDKDNPPFIYKKIFIN